MSQVTTLIDRQRVTNLLLDLCSTDSGSRKERLMADKLTILLRELGFTVTEDDAGAKVGGDAGNLYARLNGTGAGEPILFSCHMDRVTPGFGVKPHILDEVIYSDGTTILGADDAAGLAALIEAVRVTQEQNLPHPTIEFALSICEEVGLLGARNLDFGWFTAKRGFALDAGGPVGEIVIQAPFSAKLNATFHGRAAHAGLAPEKGISAIQIAAQAISAMKLLRIDHETTANIGSIVTNGPTNIVPENCTIVAETRSLNVAKLEAQLAHMTQVMEAAAKAHDGSVTIEAVRSNSGFTLATDAGTVSEAAAAARSIGEKAYTTSSGGGSDANIFNGNGIEMAVLGVGYEEIHSTREHMSIEQLVKLAAWVVAIMIG